MSPPELAALMIKVGGEDLRKAMVKAASIAAAPRAPGVGGAASASTRPPKSPTPNLVPRQPAPAPALERTRPEAVAPQKTIAPPPI